MFCGMTVGWATAYFPEMLKARLAAGLILKMINEKPRIDSYSAAGITTVCFESADSSVSN